MNEIAERVPARLSWAELERRIKNIGTLRKVLPWYIGDLMIAAEPHGEKAWQLFNEFGYTEGALTNFKYIAKRFPPEERSHELAFSVYQAIAPFHKKDREKLITQALSGEINRARIRELSRNGHGSMPDDPKSVSDGSKGARNAIPEVVEVLENGVAEAIVNLVKLMKREERGPLTAAALDELISAAMAYREKLK